VAGSLRRLLEEVRVLPTPTNNSTALVGSLVAFREEDGPEEVWQLVPPLEADVGASKISVLTPIGEALFGHRVGEVVEVQAPSGAYPAEITAIELP
jgi:transcription elongation factor GreA